MYLWEPEVYGITPLTEDTARTFKHTRREAVGPCTRRGPLDRLEEVVVEVKSVNHKFCEVKVRLPRELAALETALVRRIKDRVARGSLDVTVKRSSRGAVGLVPVVDAGLAKEYRRAFAELAAAAGVPDTTTVKELAGLPNVLKLEEPAVDLSKVSTALEAAVDQSLAALEAMRTTEGRAIEKDLLARLEAVEKSVLEVEKLSPASVGDYRKRLTERISELTQGMTVDPQRIAGERVGGAHQPQTEPARDDRHREQHPADAHVQQAHRHADHHQAPEAEPHHQARRVRLLPLFDRHCGRIGRRDVRLTNALRRLLEESARMVQQVVIERPPPPRTPVLRYIGFGALGLGAAVGIVGVVEAIISSGQASSATHHTSISGR